MRSCKLVFENTDEARERFELLYSGFVNGGAQGQRGGIETMRREAKILDKLESVSELHEGRACGECGQLIAGKQRLNDGEQEVSFDQPELALVKKHIENCPWTTRMSRKIVDLIDWLESQKLE